MDSLGQDNFCRLARYESSIDRAFYRASKELQTLQKTRIGFARQNETQAQEEPTTTTEPQPRTTTPPKRFSLQPNGKLIQLPNTAVPPQIGGWPEAV